MIWALSEEQIRSTFPLVASDKGPAPTKEDDPFDRLPADFRAERLWLDSQRWEKWDPTKKTADSTLSRRREFLREFAETDASKNPPLGALPVVVVSSEPAAPKSERHTREEAGPRLDFLSSHTLHVTASGSGQEIHLYQPDVVVNALKQIVSAIRGGMLLSHDRRGTRYTPLHRGQTHLSRQAAP